MKTLILSSAIVLGLAAPSLANDQLAAGLGVDADRYSVAELVQLRRALESDDHSFVNFATRGDLNSGGYSARVNDIVSTLAEQDDDGPVGRFVRDRGNEVISTQSFGGTNDAGRALAIDHAEQNQDLVLQRILEAGGSLRGVQGLF